MRLVLSGSAGCGKSTLAQALASNGAPRNVLRARNRWVQLANHAAILGHTMMEVSAERVLCIPADVAPEAWLDYVVESITER